jgi:SecD/SecF fusion protein
MNALQSLQVLAFNPLHFLAEGLRDPLAMFLFGLTLLILFFWYFATDIEKRKRNIGSIIILLVAGLCALALLTKPLRGGVDIVGGSSFTLRVQPKIDDTGTPIAISTDAINHAISTIRQRLDPKGVLDLIIQQQGTDKILVQMPGISTEEGDLVRKKLEQVALLELKEVHPQTDRIDASGRTLAQRVEAGDEFEPGYQAYSYLDKESGMTSALLLRRISALDGTDVDAAYPDYARPGHINVVLNGEGGKKMIALTQNMQPGAGRIAILLDDVVLSAPTVQSVPLGSRFEISGLDGKDEAKNLSEALMNPMKNPLLVDEQRKISPSLGAGVVKQGIYAGVAGLTLTFIFVAIYYRLAGVIALVGLAFNIMLLFGIMAMFGFTFTLPGIAGIVLSVGMAVDANVLIYERLREELEAGKSLRNAIQAAYEKAFSAIFDANLTSLITAIILFWRASGTVKGFAVTLTVGLLASMMAALMVTRVLFWWGNDKKLLTKLSFLSLVPNNLNFDFLGKRRVAAVISIGLAVTALATMGIKQERALGIDFTGGTLIRFQLNEAELPTAEAQKAIKDVKLTASVSIQQEVSPASGRLLTVKTASEDAAAVTSALRANLPILAEQAADGKYVVVSDQDEVKATLGREFLFVSLTALGLGLLGILVYITLRYELSFAVGAFTALVHDIFITIGLVVLFGGELSLIHVGAILTIAGYSINDTIIVFDRMRESFQLRRGNDIKGVMNEAINATLSRTVLTSSTTIFTVGMLYIFGGAALKEFSFMILIGLLVGTYSSIFVASPIVLWWARIRGTNLNHDNTDVKAIPSEYKAVQ